MDLANRNQHTSDYNSNSTLAYLVFVIHIGNKICTDGIAIVVVCRGKIVREREHFFLKLHKEWDVCLVVVNEDE